MLRGVEQDQAVVVQSGIEKGRDDLRRQRLHGRRHDAGIQRYGVRFVQIDLLAEGGAGRPEGAVESWDVHGVLRDHIADRQQFPEVEAAVQVLLLDLTTDEVEVGLEVVAVVPGHLGYVVGH